MTQLDMNYNPTPPVAASHPATSHEAAERVKPKTPTIRAKVWGLLKQRGPMTDRELLAAYNQHYGEARLDGTIRARRVELVREGRVVATGKERDGMREWMAK